MAYEIELKAHVREEDVEAVKQALNKMSGVTCLGSISKFDIYWSQTDDGEPLFRVRRELTDKGPDILFTAKPSKSKTDKGTEENEEFEFTTSDDQWDSILNFFSGIGLQICRLKWKKGTHFHAYHKGYKIHIELLDVRFLGWFLEMEICSPTLEGFDDADADRALREVLSMVGLSEKDVEPRGYNRMLKALGHDKG